MGDYKIELGWVMFGLAMGVLLIPYRKKHLPYDNCFSWLILWAILWPIFLFALAKEAIENYIRAWRDYLEK